jgi:HKD family nuclease
MSEQNEIYGWYEHLLTASLQGKIESMGNAEPRISDPDIEALRSMLAFHLRPLVAAALEDRSSGEQLALMSDLVRVLSTVDESIRGETPGARFLRMLPDPRFTTAGQVSALIDAQMPKTGFSHSELFTGSQRSLSLDDEIRREILSSSRIDMLVSFIRWSGLRLVMDAVKQAIDGGSAIRVISTVYLGATEQKAITSLKEVGADVRLSYNTTRGRLHAKAWVFHRPHGLGSVYVGSSNLSRDALQDGLEWNVKATERELSFLFKRTSDSFEALWNDPEFERYEAADANRLHRALEQASFGSGSYRLRDLPRGFKK